MKLTDHPDMGAETNGERSDGYTGSSSVASVPARRVERQEIWRFRGGRPTGLAALAKFRAFPTPGPKINTRRLSRHASPGVSTPRRPLPVCAPAQEGGLSRTCSPRMYSDRTAAGDYSSPAPSSSTSNPRMDDKDVPEPWGGSLTKGSRHLRCV